MPRRLIRHSDPEPEDPEPEEEDEQFPKVEAAVQDAEDSRFLHLKAIGGALVEEIGSKGADGVNNGSGERFDVCAARLREHGHDHFTAERLREIRDTYEAHPAEVWDAAEESGVSFTVLCELRHHPERLRDLLACLEGQRPASLAGLKTMYQGEDTSLATAIRRRGKVIKSDARIALGYEAVGQPTASDRQSGQSGPIVEDEDRQRTEPSRQERIEIAREVMTTPDLAVEVVEDPEAREAAYETSRAAMVKASGQDVSYSAEKPRPRGNLAKLSITASSGKAKHAVDDWVADLRRVAEVDDSTRDFVHATTQEIRIRCDEADSLAEGGAVADEASDYLKGEQ